MTFERILPPLILVILTSNCVHGAKPSRPEQFGGQQCFSFRDDPSTDGILSDLNGDYCSSKPSRVFSEITRVDRYALDTFNSQRTVYIDFSNVVEGTEAELPASGYYAFSLSLKAGGLSTFEAGESRFGIIAIDIYSPRDDISYRVTQEAGQTVVTAEDANGNGVVDTFHVDVTESLRVERLYSSPGSRPVATLGRIMAPFSATISDAELP